jgi:uncharacterized membrane protein
MSWNRWYATRSYLRSALWIVPLIALVLEQIAIRAVFSIEASTGWIPQINLTVTGAIGATDEVVTLTTAFMVFTFGSLLVAIQVASGQLTPRIIATTLLPDNVIRWTVGLFVFSLLFAVGTKIRLDRGIHHLAVTITELLGIASTTMFLFLIDHTARLLRPITIVWRIGEQGVKVVETVYPDAADARRLPGTPRELIGTPGQIIEHVGTSAIVLAVNLKRLVGHCTPGRRDHRVRSPRGRLRSHWRAAVSVVRRRHDDRRPRAPRAGSLRAGAYYRAGLDLRISRDR